MHISWCYFCQNKLETTSVQFSSVAQSCPTLCDPMDYTAQARILEWVAVPFSKVSSQPRNRIQVSHIAGRFFTSKAEVDVFLECSCFFYDPGNVGNLISGFFAFSKPSLTWKFSGHVLLKPSLENFEHHFASV